MDELRQLYAQVERGAKARRLLENEDLQAVFTELLNGYQLALFSTKPTDAEAREDFYRRHKGLQDVLDDLTASAQAGEQAAMEIASMEQATDI